MPVIVLEGVDGSGKSTLAEEIVALAKKEKPDADARIVHLGPPASADRESIVCECIDPLQNYLVSSDDVVVFDRAHWGSPVYGPMYRPEQNPDGYGDITRAGWRYTELAFEALGCVTLFVDTQPDVAAERCAERGEDYINLEHLPKLQERYREIFHESLTGVLRSSLLEPEDTPRLAQETLDLARTSHSRTEKLAAWPAYAGTLEPRLFVVCPPDVETRLAALEELSDEYPWQAIGLAWADDTDQLTSLWHAIGKPPIALYGLMTDYESDYSALHWALNRV
jgi:thymidylate kinase